MMPGAPIGPMGGPVGPMMGMPAPMGMMPPPGSPHNLLSLLLASVCVLMKS